MSVSFSYVARETLTNIRRNWLVTVAAVLTATVSLSLLGITMLLWRGVDQATIQWHKNVQVNIYMKKDISDADRKAIEKGIKDLPTVKKYYYFNSEDSYKEFRRWTYNRRKIFEDVRQQDIPTSFRIVPKNVDYVDQIGAQFENSPGVKEVVYAKKAIEKLKRITGGLQVGMAIGAGVLLFSAVLLILNTIQMAIYNRRREVAVMKLVGASNWFIRVPFMGEGMIQGLAGSAIAVVVFVGLWMQLHAKASASDDLLYQLVPQQSAVVGVAITIFFIGAALGIIGSATAVRRHLKV